jgi:hypothetical protein
MGRLSGEAPREPRRAWIYFFILKSTYPDINFSDFFEQPVKSGLSPVLAFIPKAQHYEKFLPAKTLFQGLFYPQNPALFCAAATAECSKMQTVEFK